jgi:hypothetical protein
MQSVWFYTFEVIGSEKFPALYRHSHRQDEMLSGLGLKKTALCRNVDTWVFAGFLSGRLVEPPSPPVSSICVMGNVFDPL